MAKPGASLKVDTDLVTDPKAFHAHTRQHSRGIQVSPRDHDSDRYDPAGQELVKGEPQWRIKFVMPNIPVPVQRILGVSRTSIKIYDKQGQTLMHEFPLEEISGFQCDSGRQSVFFLFGFGTPEKNTYNLHSAQYHLRIHEEIQKAIGALLKEKKVANPQQVMEQSGITQVAHTGTLEVIKQGVRRLSRASAEKKPDLSAADAYAPPPAPDRRDSAVIKEPQGSKKKEKAAKGDFVELDDG